MAVKVGGKYIYRYVYMCAYVYVHMHVHMYMQTYTYKKRDKEGGLELMVAATKLAVIGVGGGK